MTDHYPLRPLIRRVGAVLAMAMTMAACGAGTGNVIPANITQPDRYLMDRANEEFAKRHWLNAREYYRQVVDNYPGSPLRAEAKLGLGDTQLGENTTESLILAANEYREFLTFYPTHPRADYAQYKVAMSHYAQMRAPERDQTETREALREFNAFFDRYPNSALMPEVRQKWREARDRLSEASFGVGFHYFRVRWYPGAIDRFREVLREDPEYSGRDRVYYYLAESLARSNQTAEAIPYFQRLLDEFGSSELVSDTRKRLGELNASR